MKRFATLLILIFTLGLWQAHADEGMWLPSLLKGYTIKDMQAKGFQLSAEDIYSINSASLKDAVVRFGRGCTGGVISPEGLVLTNHHCAYGNIQALSSVEHDYLTHGYHATNRKEELPCPGLTVTFLQYMEDVTKNIMEGVHDNDSESARAATIEKNITTLIASKKAQNGELSYEIKPLFYGNQYMLYAYLIYRDVRLVVAPPSAIGKFGGDSDNWMWPRHTGDFTLLRIYAGKDNKPADWSADNVPFKPKKFFTLSTAGVNQEDFAMVFGYPGTTKRYLASQEVEEIMAHSDPRKVALRDKRLEVMGRFMATNDTIRIQYASKHASVANAWKKWQGESLGLRRLNAVQQKQQLENQFKSWYQASPERQAKYGKLLEGFESIYATLAPLELAADYFNQGLMGIESLSLARSFANSNLDNKGQKNLSDEALNKLKTAGENYFKNYDPRVDRELMNTMLEAYTAELPTELQLPSIRKQLATAKDQATFATNIFANSIFTDRTRFEAWATTGNIKALQNDPLFAFAQQLRQEYKDLVATKRTQSKQQLDPLYRLYVQGLREMQPEGNFFPDANSTLRVAYGKVEGYKAREAVLYTHQTTLDGVVEKVAMGAHDYIMPERLRTLYDKKDYGRWELNGSVPVCFSASIHTTGGNSGSPVLNAKGQLIGLNFDRVWEGTMSDVMFDPAMCRNITVDIRYILFLIEKYAGAGYLLDEMSLAK